MISFLFLVFLAQASLSSITHSQQLPLPENIFILAGQSNMAGRGGVYNTDKPIKDQYWDGIVPPQCQPNPSILRLSANLTWVEAHVPLHADIDVNNTNGVGPGMSFANTLLNTAPIFGVGAIGLVPCAVGGTTITEWTKGGFLYEQMVNRTKVALQNGGIIRAMLWYQGESDTTTLEDIVLYKTRLEKFFKDIRTDLRYPTLPIFQVIIESGLGDKLSVQLIRIVQQLIDLPNLVSVDSKGLPLGPDKVHLTTPAQVQLGEKLAQAFLQSWTSSTQISWM